MHAPERLRGLLAETSNCIYTYMSPTYTHQARSTNLEWSIQSRLSPEGVHVGRLLDLAAAV